MARSTLLDDLGALDPVDDAKVVYENLKKHPDWNTVLTDTQKDDLFRRYQPGASRELQGSDLRATRGSYEAEVAPVITAPPVTTPWSMAVPPSGEATASMTLGTRDSPAATVPGYPTQAQLAPRPINQPAPPPAAPEGPSTLRWIGEDIVAPTVASMLTSQGGRMAGAAAGGAVGGPLGAMVGGGLGGMVGAGAAEYGRQVYKGEPISLSGIGTAAVMEGAVGPVLGVGKRLVQGVGGVKGRLPGAVQAAGQEAADAVRGLVAPIAARAAPVRKLFAEFDAALQTTAQPIRTTNIQDALVDIAQRFPGLNPAQTGNLVKLHAATENLKAVLTTHGPLPPAPSQILATINDLYQQVNVLDDMISTMAPGKASSNLKHLRGAIMRDVEAYAAQPGAHKAAGALLAANRAFQAKLAAKRIGRMIQQVLPDTEDVFDAKKARQLAKALRRDDDLAGLLGNPLEVDALVEAVMSIGRAVPQKLPRAVGSSVVGGLAGTGTGAAFGGLMTGGIGAIPGAVAGAVVGTGTGILARMTPEVWNEAIKTMPALTARARMIGSAALHLGRAIYREHREAEITRLRRDTQLRGQPGMIPQPRR